MLLLLCRYFFFGFFWVVYIFFSKVYIVVVSLLFFMMVRGMGLSGRVLFVERVQFMVSVDVMSALLSEAHRRGLSGRGDFGRFMRLEVDRLVEGYKG